MDNLSTNTTGTFHKARQREAFQFAWLQRFYSSHTPGQSQAGLRSCASSVHARPRKAQKVLCGILVGITLAAGMKKCAAADVPSELINAIHQVETSGRLGPIKGDNGRALGPLQIHRAYWIDAGVPGRYEDCARLDYSVRVFNAYMARYAPHGDFETIARIHNGGPRGHRKTQTLRYWRAVRKHLEKNK